MKEIELIEKRKTREKHFLQEDGTIIAKIYDNDIHFLKDGKYEEIDNQLIKENDYYVNKKNAYKVFFKENSKFDLMRMEKSSHYLDIKLKDEKETFLKKSKNVSKFMDYVKYEDILDNIDLEYKVLPTKVKESIIIKNRNNIPSKLDFIVDTNLQLILNENKSISVKNDEEILFRIEAPYMVDSNNKVNNNIYYELFQNNGKYELSLKLDTAWLNREDIVYPITIDPTITNSSKENSVYDTYIYEGDTNVDRNSHDFLKVGVTKVGEQNIINRALLKFDLPTIGTGSQIISAILSTIGYPYEKNTTDIDTICVHQITSDWLESEANWENMHDKYDGRIETCFMARRSFSLSQTVMPAYNYANITNLVKKWYLNTPNYGVMLKLNKETYKGEIIPAFYSKNNTTEGDNNPKPLLLIRYRNTNGIEDYMHYQKIKFAGGSSNINTYNGNLVTVFDLGKTIGSKLPIQLSLIYNTNDVVLKKNYGYGLGYKLNFHQMIKDSTINDELSYIEYIDADGTIHYFKEQNGIYIDEDGLNLNITKSDNECILSDKYGNITRFVNNNGIYYMKELIDLDNNKIEIIYNLDNTISKIIDSNNQEINIIYGIDKISIITQNDTFVLNYADSQINSIVNSTSTVLLTYYNKLISKITDKNSKELEFEYYNEKPYRIKKVTEYGIDSTIGAFFNVEYGFESTTIIDNKNRATTFVYNENGNVMSISNLKESEDVKNAYSKRESIGITDSQYKNKLLTSRIPIKYVNNLLTDTSFENSEVKFSSSDDVTLSIDEEFVKSGVKSLKVVNTAANKTLSYSVSVPKGENYTFSAYLKNTNNIKLALSYLNVNNEVVENISEVIYTNNDFMRYDVTVNYPADSVSDLTIKVYLLETGTTYIDDIQLEEGEVANNYNIIDNSNFSNGTTGWTLNASTFEGDETIVKDTKDYFEVITSSTGEKMLKVKMDPEVSTSLYKPINISGKEGDLYNLSFWYKSDGINISDQGYSYNTVAFNFYDENNPDIGSGSILSMPLNPNSKNWQYFSQNFVAPRDYTNFSFNLFQSMNANDLYITNISLFKDIREAYYDYDDMGNPTLIRGLDNEEETYKYDFNNQLIKFNKPLGNYFTIEYDNDITTRPLKTISATGISNETKYDMFGNSVRTMSKYVGADNELTSGLYCIRKKGTNEYLKYINNTLTFNINNHDKWNIEKIGDYYKINHSIIQNKYLTSIDNNLLLLDYQEDNSLFSLVKNDNGSYTIKSKINTMYLKKENNDIILSTQIDDSSNFEFYFEMDNDSKFIESTAEYTDDGKFIKNTIDSTFNKVSYEIDNNNGLLKSYTNNKNIKTVYNYNDRRQLLSCDNNGQVINYSYDNNYMLKTIELNNKIYNIVYDDFLINKEIKIGNMTLITNNYEENNGNLSSLLYGNNNIIKYVYDEFDRIKTLTKMDGEYNYKYDNNGDLKKILSNDGIIKYTYDLARRIHEYRNNDFSINYTYDKNDNVSNKVYNLEQIINSVDYAYNAEEKLSNIKIDNVEIKLEYDTLGRIIKNIINNQYNSSYKYVTNGKRTSLLIEEIKNGSDKIKYKYDTLKNITHIYNNDFLSNKYYYDDYNELIREDNYLLNKTIRYKYDNEGNLLFKREYKLNTYNLLSENVYSYEDSNWKDKLTKFNNDFITYDNIGNPLTIGNDITLSWINGRELESYIDNNYDIIYKYNLNNIRTSKIVNNQETKYYLEDTKIILEKTGKNVLYYIYDNNLNNLVAFKYNNSLYYYIKNLQDDVVGILDNNYNVICRYEYDSFGNILSITDNIGVDISDDDNHIANINPFRYRSYYYDKETKLYYLNSRYYNPKWGRFINADGTINANQIDNPLGYNLFIYSDNNYINNVDSDGNFALSAFLIKVGTGALVGIGCQLLEDGVNSIINGKFELSSWQTYAGAAVGGSFGNLLGGTKLAGSVLGKMVIAGTSNAISNITTKTLNVITEKEELKVAEDSLDLLVDVTLGVVTSSIPLEMPKVLNGSGNYGAVYKAGLTKLSKGYAKRMSTKVIAKGIVSEFVDSIFSTGINIITGRVETTIDNYYNYGIIPKVYWDVG